MKLARESFKLLRALAGNDKVKASIIQHGAAPIINDVLDKHKVNFFLEDKHSVGVPQTKFLFFFYRKMKLLPS